MQHSLETTEGVPRMTMLATTSMFTNRGGWALRTTSIVAKWNRAQDGARARTISRRRHRVKRRGKSTTVTTTTTSVMTWCRGVVRAGLETARDEDEHAVQTQECTKENEPKENELSCQHTEEAFTEAHHANTWRRHIACEHLHELHDAPQEGRVHAVDIFVSTVACTGAASQLNHNGERIAKLVLFAIAMSACTLLPCWPLQ
jgi:hypothetical protein